MVFFDQRLRPHSQSEASFQSTIRGTGSHLTLDIVPRYGNANTTRNLLSKGCTPYVMAELPKSHFFDIYELQNLEHLISPRVFGEQDLEQPIWSTHGWGSFLITEFRMHASETSLQIPFHARYLNPVPEDSARSSTILAPQVFYACPLQDSAFEDNPWNTYSLKEDLIGPDHLFRFYRNSGARNFTLQLPAAEASSTPIVLWMTILTILIGFIYVILQLPFLHSTKRITATPTEQLIDTEET